MSILLALRGANASQAPRLTFTKRSQNNLLVPHGARDRPISSDRCFIIRPRLFILQSRRILNNNHGLPNPLCTFLPFPTSFQPKREPGGHDQSVGGRLYADERFTFVSFTFPARTAVGEPPKRNIPHTSEGGAQVQQGRLLS